MIQMQFSFLGIRLNRTARRIVDYQKEIQYMSNMIISKKVKKKTYHTVPCKNVKNIKFMFV